jgi:hypothetical protein
LPDALQLLRLPKLGFQALSFADVTKAEDVTTFDCRER